MKILYAATQEEVESVLDPCNAAAKSPTSTEPFALVAIVLTQDSTKYWFKRTDQVGYNIADGGGTKKAEIDQAMTDAVIAGDLTEVEKTEQELISEGWYPVAPPT